SFDKDFVRRWVVERCDPYSDPIPDIPAEVTLEAARIYISVFEAITGQTFPLPSTDTPVLERIRANLARFF
ncbi:MAG TPA: phosphoribosylaminoimidazolesuccinocarboxamide synthase, partial [Acetobacteraceae bacterium]|nr:phosphoribosylaminoimidazolesuccinocarboxamide synthase [Acetobacteraceae bacterium]